MSVTEQDDLAALGRILAHLANAVKAEEGVHLSRLQGILSQLPRSVLGPYSANQDTIRLIAKRFPDRIVVATDNKVYTRSGLWEKQAGQKTHEPAGKQQYLASGDPPVELHNVGGKVSKLLMLYGFVDLEPPHRVSVFFDKRFFDGNRHYDLTKSWLKVGDRVILDAVRSPPGYRAKYQATRIEAVKKMEQNPAPSRTASETDGGSRVIYGCPGTIQAVNPSHGFILFGQDNRDCAYFVIDNVDKSMLKPGKNLDDIFKAGSKVQFDAQPNPKPSTFSKWWATNVRKVPCAPSGRASDSGDEAFLSDHEIAELLLETKEFSARRKLSGIRGTFYPNSKNTGLVAAFDQNIMVRVVVDVAYCDGKKLRSFGELLKDISLQDDVEVFVDAVEAEHDVWVATLMWTGERPPHPLVDQSERAFQGALALALTEMPATTREDVANLNAPAKFCTEVDHDIAVYPNSKGILKVVDDNRAVCEVQEPEGCRNVEFVTFYRNKVPHMGRFRSVLREGDMVHIDYMVGAVGSKDEVCCRVVWQGDRPACDRLTSPAEFSLMLKGRATAESLTNITGGPQGRPSEPPSCTQVPETNLNSFPQGPGCSKWPLLDSFALEGVDKRNPPSTGSTTGSAPVTGKAVGGHPPPEEPKVYVFPSRKGTVVEVCESAAIVEVREGSSIRELTVTVDCFYYEGRPFLNNLARVLHKGAMLNVDYMVGRVGGKDRVHCDLAWLGPKPQGVPCLSEDEFRQQLGGRGSGHTFINDLQSTTLELNNLSKDAPRGPAKQALPHIDRPQVCQPPPQSSSLAVDTRPQTEVYRPCPQLSLQAADTLLQTELRRPLPQSSQAADRPHTETFRPLPQLSQAADNRPLSQSSQAADRLHTEVFRPLPQSSQPADFRPQTEVRRPLPQSSQAADFRPQTEVRRPLPQSSQAADFRPQTEVHRPLPQSSQAADRPHTEVFRPLPQLSQAADFRPQTEVRRPLPQSSQAADFRPQTEVHRPLLQSSQAADRSHTEVFRPLPQSQAADFRPQTEVCWPLPQSSQAADRPHTEVFRPLPQLSQANCPQTEVRRPLPLSSEAADTRSHTEVYWQPPQTMPHTVTSAQEVHHLPPQSQVVDTRSQMEAYQPPTKSLSEVVDTYRQMQVHKQPPQSLSQATNARSQLDVHRQAPLPTSQAKICPQMEMHQTPPQSLSHNNRPQMEAYRQPPQLLLKTVDTNPQVDVHWQPPQPLSQAVDNTHPPMEAYRQEPQVNICRQDTRQSPTQSLSHIVTRSQMEVYQQAAQVMSQVNICPQKEANQAPTQSLSHMNIRPQTEGCRPFPQSVPLVKTNSHMEEYRQAPQAESQMNMSSPREVNQDPTQSLSRVNINAQTEGYRPLLQSVSQVANINSETEAYRQPPQVVSQTADTSSQMEVHGPLPHTSEPCSTDSSHLPKPTSSETSTRRGSFNVSDEMYNRVVEIVREQNVALIRAEIREVLRDVFNSQGLKVPNNTSMLQGQGDGGPAVGPTERQPTSVPCPNVLQKPHVAAGSSRPSDMWDAAAGKREVQPPPGFNIPPSRAPPKAPPVTVGSTWQTSNVSQQPSTSWCKSASQFEGQPQASSNVNPTFIPREASPPATIHSSWQPSNVPQQPEVAADAPPAWVSQQTWRTDAEQHGGGQPSGFDVATTSVPPEAPPATAQLEDDAHGSRWEMQQNVSTFQGHEGNPQDMQDLGISFDDSLAEGDELSEDDIRQLGLFGTHHGDEGAALSSLEIKIPNL